MINCIKQALHFENKKSRPTFCPPYAKNPMFQFTPYLLPHLYKIRVRMAHPYPNPFMSCTAHSALFHEHGEPIEVVLRFSFRYKILGLSIIYIYIYIENQQLKELYLLMGELNLSPNQLKSTALMSVYQRIKKEKRERGNVIRALLQSSRVHPPLTSGSTPAS